MGQAVQTHDFIYFLKIHTFLAFILQCCVCTGKTFLFAHTLTEYLSISNDVCVGVRMCERKNAEGDFCIQRAVLKIAPFRPGRIRPGGKTGPLSGGIARYFCTGQCRPKPKRRPRFTASTCLVIDRDECFSECFLGPTDLPCQNDKNILKMLILYGTMKGNKKSFTSKHKFQLFFVALWLLTLVKWFFIGFCFRSLWHCVLYTFYPGSSISCQSGKNLIGAERT